METTRGRASKQLMMSLLPDINIRFGTFWLFLMYFEPFSLSAFTNFIRAGGSARIMDRLAQCNLNVAFQL